MRVHVCRNRDDYFALVNGPELTVRWMLESHLAQRHSDRPRFEIPGICTVCNTAVDFTADFEGAWVSPQGLRVPNWRECLRCPACSMNGRQRIVAALAREYLLNASPKERCDAYVMEQVSPLYSWLTTAFSWVQWTGSEYLGPGVAHGAVHGDRRHEDAECLSFPDASMDLVVSCDVLEHVNQPAQALREIVRILRVGGEAIMTFPMDPHLGSNRRRAEVIGGTIHHSLEPIFHGNPISPDGSLVFTDFGWEVLTELRDAGLTDATLNVYWSYVLGYLGIQFYFRGHKA
jgi:SAM-dependent methyltransferase